MFVSLCRLLGFSGVLEVLRFGVSGLHGYVEPESGV